MDEEAQLYLTKAEESLAGAESEVANNRYNNAVNRCYYACFQAAIAALILAGIRPSAGRSGRQRWGHDFVQAQFVGQLINRRKLYPTELRGALLTTYAQREAGDYHPELVNRRQAERTLRQAQHFLEAIRQGGDQP